MSADQGAKRLEMALIVCDADIQMREALDQRAVADYTEQMQESVIFPPIDVFFDGDTYWLADGFHRFKAAEKTGHVDIDARVHEGSKRDAILFAAGANATHGLRRTNADKRKAVMALLRDHEWGGKSDRQIADKAAVSQPFVSGLRQEATDNGYQLPERTIGKDGKARSANRTSASRSDTDEAPVPTPDQVGADETTGLAGGADNPAVVGHETLPDEPEEVVRLLRSRFGPEDLQRIAKMLLTEMAG